jgi:hypothetical protein
MFGADGTFCLPTKCQVCAPHMHTLLALLTLLWGCPLLCKAWKANHHPQKRHIPRQAGHAQTNKQTVKPNNNLMQTLKNSKWLLKLLHIIACFLIYHEAFFVYNGDTENTEIFFFMVSL